MALSHLPLQAVWARMDDRLADRSVRVVKVSKTVGQTTPVRLYLGYRVSVVRATRHRLRARVLDGGEWSVTYGRRGWRCNCACDAPCSHVQAVAAVCDLPCRERRHPRVAP